MDGNEKTFPNNFIAMKTYEQHSIFRKNAFPNNSSAKIFTSQRVNNKNETRKTLNSMYSTLDRQKKEVL